MTDTMCCPLQTSDEGPSCYSTCVRRARKDHTCSECRSTIARGEKYNYDSGIWDGRPDSFKTCLLCVEIRTHFSCEGWVYGCLWGDLQENFFPDMKSGGPCMFGLSPEAKQKLIDERMEWYFELDEIDDSAWENWTNTENGKVGR